MKLEIEIPDEIAKQIPEGCKVVWMPPKVGMQFLGANGQIGVSVRDCDTYRHICLIPKHTWPPCLKCAAISRNQSGYIAHLKTPSINSNGEWCSAMPWCLYPSFFTDPLPALEVGECFFNPNWQE